jgi:hypothetical protein
VPRGRERVALAGPGKELTTTKAALEAFTIATLRKLAAGVEGDLERGLHSGSFRHAHAAPHRVAGAIEAGARRSTSPATAIARLDALRESAGPRTGGARAARTSGRGRPEPKSQDK